MEEYLIKKAVLFSKTYDTLIKNEIKGINIGNQKELTLKNIDHFIDELILVCKKQNIDIDELTDKLGCNKDISQDVFIYIMSGIEQRKGKTK